LSEPFLGEIRLFGFNFSPRGWAVCAGQIMSIQQNTALFSLLGTQYGGNGVQTFGLPDLRGRVAINQGQGPGLQNYDIGEITGSETVTLTSQQMPIHTHLQPVTNGPASTSRPHSTVPAAGGSYAAAGDGGAFVPPSTAGGSQPFSILQPLLVLNYCIALQGIFPSRN
jgi:microcystin-dependent protein